MTDSRKVWLLVLLGVLLLGLVALAASFTRSELQPGQPFRLEEEVEAISGLDGEGSYPPPNVLLVRGLIILLVLWYPIYLLISFLTKRGRKRLLTDLIRLGLILLFLFWLDRRAPAALDQLSEPTAVTMDLQVTPNPAAQLVEFDPESAPPWISTALLVGAALFLTALAAGIAWWWLVPDWRKGKEAGPSPSQLLAETAGEAAEAIEAGQDFKDVILNAYFQMARILAEARDLERPNSMTPSEFAAALSTQGLPSGAVLELTRLFEWVRYGGHKAGEDMESRAVKALRAIEVSVR